MRWFINPESTRLSIGDGEWIDVKQRLTHGEREGMLAAMSPFVNPGEPIQLARKEIRTGLVNAYLLGWSLRRPDAQGQPKPVPMNPELPDNERLRTIRSLSVDAFDAIHAAVDAHADAMKAIDAAEKNDQAGGNGSSAISPLLEPVTGDTSGSAN